MDELEQLIRGSQTSQPSAKKDYGGLVTDDLLDRLKKVESGKDPYAVNKQTKALGPYQFMPETVADLHRKGYKFNAFDEKESREAAKKYLTELVNKSGGDLDKALAAYGGFVTKDPTEYISKVKGAVPGRKPEAAPVDDLEQLIRGTARAPQAQPATKQEVKQGVKPEDLSKPYVGYPTGKKPAVERLPEQPSSFEQLGQIGPGLASLADVTIGGIIPSVAGPLTYAGARAMQKSPEEAAALQQKVVGATESPFGKAFGVTESPAYKGEAARQIMDFIGQNISKGAEWIAQKTGLPVGDVENMMGTAMVGATPAVSKAIPKAAGAVQAVRDVRSQMQDQLAQRQVIQGNVPEQARQMSPQDVATMQAQFEAKRAAPTVQPTQADLVGVGAAQVQPEKLRVQRAKELPVPIELSKDQATRDPADVRFARETAKDPVLGQALQAKYADDNLKIQKNLDHFVENSGAEFTGAAPGEVGQMLVNAIGPYQQSRKAAIGTAYDAARAAGQMDVPVQISRLSEFVDKNQSAAKNAPVISAVGSEIKRLAKDGEISINDLEEIRKMAGVLAQDSGPNSHYGRQAIRIIDKMTEGKGGTLYQKARRLNADYMREFEDTPVVRNILSMKKGTTQRAVAIEDLVEKSMLKGPRSDVLQLFSTLEKAGPEGQQMINEMRGYVAQRIKDEATKGVGRDINGLPYVSTHGLNKMIVDLDRSGKLELLFGKQGAEQYRTLNEVTKDLQTVPVGTTNPSGTASTLLAAMAEMGAQTAMTGVPLPVAMIGKQIYGKVQTNKKLNKIRDFVEYSKEK